MQVTNSITAMREVLRQSDSALRQVRTELGKARARAETAEGALAAIHADRAELEEARCLLEAAFAEQSERAAEIEELRRRMGEEQERALVAHERWESAKATVRAQDQRIDSLRTELESAELRIASAEEYARLAGDKAAESEDAARVAEGAVASAEERAAAAERAAAVAEEAAGRAVDDFRRSIAFEEELADATAGSYLLGFRDCKEKVSRVYGLAGVEDLEPDDLPESPSSPTGARPTEQAEVGQAPGETEAGGL